MIVAKSLGKIWDVRHGDTGVVTDTEAVTTLFTQIFYLTMVPMLYLGFLELSQEISDPFGTDPNDFPRAMLHNVMHDECESFFRVAEKPPPELNRIINHNR